MPNNNISSLHAMNLIILVLGMVLLTQFYSLLFHNVFSSAGWINFLNQMIHYNENTFLRYKFIIFLKTTAPFSTYLFAGGVFISSLACIMLLARFYVCIFVAIGFFVAWSLNWNDAGMWPFEFLFPAIFALLAGLSMRTYSLLPQSVFLEFHYSVIKTLLIIVVLSIALYYVTFIAFKESVIVNQIAFFSSINFFIINLALYYLQKKPTQENDSKGHIDTYLNIMIVIIGSMLVLQVCINYFSGVFELNNFRDNISYFANNTNAIWLREFLSLSVEYSQWVLPIYIVFEICLSICLSLLLVRSIGLVLAAVLFSVLAFSELGVSATWPPDPQNLTWEWELLFVAAVAFIIGINKIMQLKENFSFKKLILGDALGGNRSISFLASLVISLISGALLYCVALTAHFFIGDSYRITACYSGLIFSFLVFVLLISNKFRS
jgi:hypothetical protein